MLALFALACTLQTTVDDKVTETGEFGVLTVSATRAETTFTVSWRSAVPSDGYVEVRSGGEDASRIDAVDSESGLEHVVTIEALAAGELWDITAYDVTDTEELEVGSEVIDVPVAHVELPTLIPSIGMTDGPDGFVLGTTPFAGDGSAVWIMDRQGRYVWWEWEPMVSPGTEQATEVWLSEDGEWVEWIRGLPGQAIYRVRLDKTAREEIPVKDVHHAFIPVEADVWAAIVQRSGSLDGETITYDVIVEVHRDGTTRDVFDSSKAIDLEELNEDTGTGQNERTHFNGIFYDEADDAYYVSSLYRNSVIVFDRASGELIREIGGPKSDLTLTSPLGIDVPHSPRIFPDGTLVVMSNGQPDDASSSVRGFELDLDNGTYENIWGHSPGIYTATLGNADAAADGGMFICWGPAGRVSQLDASMKETWRVDTSLGGVFGFAHELGPMFGRTR